MKTKQTNMKTHHGAWGSTLMVLLWLAANICAAEVPVVIALDNPVPRLAAVKTTSTFRLAFHRIVEKGVAPGAGGAT
jgi:hypothetical protein